MIVCNVPDYGTEEVADHAIMFLLALARRLMPCHEAIRGGHLALPDRHRHSPTARQDAGPDRLRPDRHGDGPAGQGARAGRGLLSTRTSARGWTRRWASAASTPSTNCSSRAISSACTAISTRRLITSSTRQRLARMRPGRDPDQHRARAVRRRGGPARRARLRATSPPRASTWSSASRSTTTGCGTIPGSSSPRTRPSTASRGSSSCGPRRPRRFGGSCWANQPRNPVNLRPPPTANWSEGSHGQRMAQADRFFNCQSCPTQAHDANRSLALLVARGRALTAALTAVTTVQALRPVPTSCAPGGPGTWPTTTSGSGR